MPNGQKIPLKNEESPLPVDVFTNEVHVYCCVKGDQVGRNLGTGYYLLPEIGGWGAAEDFRGYHLILRRTKGGISRR